MAAKISTDGLKTPSLVLTDDLAVVVSLDDPDWRYGGKSGEFLGKGPIARLALDQRFGPRLDCDDGQDRSAKQRFRRGMCRTSFLEFCAHNAELEMHIHTSQELSRLEGLCR